MGSTFLPDRCALIDTTESNLLVRGNMPLLGSPGDYHYAYEEIQAAAKVPFDGRRIIEVPIIDNVGEREQFGAIMQSFGVDPAKYPETFWPWWMQSGYDPNQQHGSILTTEGTQRPGGVLWRPFEGLPANGNPQVFLKSPGWDYSGFVETIAGLLNSCVDTVIYVHCQLGADRTGAFHIGYLMRTRGLTLEEASKIANNSTSAGPPNEDYQRLVEAYSWILG